MSAARRRTSLVICGAAAVAALSGAPAQAALTPVPQRSVFTTDRIDSPNLAALPDGRAAVGWVNGNNNGDTTLAMVRPAGGLLPPKPQVLRTGYSSEDVLFLTGGPADSPLLTWFQDGDSRTPFAVKLEGDTFTTQSGLFSGTYGTGRFPEFARCPDGSTYFGYQYTNISPPSPVTYSIVAQRRGPNGERLPVSSLGSTGSSDTFQDPTPTCDRNDFALFAWREDNDGAGPNRYRLRVYQDGVGLLFDRTVPVGITSASTPEARVTPGGRVWIVWSEYGSGVATSYVVTRDPGVTGPIPSGSPTVLDASGGAGQVFFSPGGATHVLIAHESMTGASYGVRTAPAGSAAFGAEEPLLADGNHSARVLLGHPDGHPRLLVTEYSNTTGTPERFLVQGIPAAGSTEPSTDTGLTSLDGAGGAFAWLPSGDLLGVAVDRSGPPDSATLKEGGLDTGAPPTLNNVSVPGLAVAGQAVALGVDAGDPLGLSSFQWTADGQTLTDQDTSITLPRAGTFTVTARAVDRAGNAAAVTRTIRVLGTNFVAPNDGRKAKLSAGARRGRRGKAARSVTVRLLPDEDVAADLDLLGTLRRGKGKGTLILKSRHLAKVTAGKQRTVKLPVTSSLAALVRNRLSVRITLTDADGNRTVRTVKVKVAKK